MKSGYIHWIEAYQKYKEHSDLPAGIFTVSFWLQESPLLRKFREHPARPLPRSHYRGRITAKLVKKLL